MVYVLHIMCNTCYISTALLLAALVGPASAQTRADRLRIPRADRPPVLEDYLPGTAAPSELSVDAFRQRDPNDGDAASQATAAYVSFDLDNLYVAFVCRDTEPSRIRARLSRRDAIAQDDQVVVMLDTFHDRQRSYLFAVNPLGVQADALASEGRDDDYSFDTVWRASGRLLPDGFAVLMTIPFKSLRIAAGPDGTWGIAFSRVLPRNSEQSFWPLHHPTGRGHDAAVRHAAATGAGLRRTEHSADSVRRAVERPLSRRDDQHVRDANRSPRSAWTPRS